MIEPGFELVYEAEARLGPPVAQGPAPDGERRFIPILGGHFAGPRLKGEILPGGADGTVIQVRNRGLRHGPPELMAALGRGERVDPASIYFRAAPSFTVATGPHDWLNRSLFVCTGERWPDGIRLWIWRVI